MNPQNAPIVMICPDLKTTPSFNMPAGYSLRTYQPGDEQNWVKIQTVADRYNTITPALFDQEFGRNEVRLAERQLYLCNAEGTPVGTATAWFDHHYHGQIFGRIHWVAVVPQQQGRGLAKPLLAATCHRLQALGYHQAYLITSTARIPAINLYLKFGFKPQIDHTQEVEVWRSLQPHLNVPIKLEKTR